MALYRVNGWKGHLEYNIQHHSRNRTMYEWSGRPCLGSLPFRRRHPVSLPEQIQTLFFFPLAIEIEAGRWSRACYMSGRLVSSALLTRFVRQQKDSKILFDEIRFIAHFLSIISLSCRTRYLVLYMSSFRLLAFVTCRSYIPPLRSLLNLVTNLYKNPSVPRSDEALVTASSWSDFSSNVSSSAIV
jgi:hypothetical protein